MKRKNLKIFIKKFRNLKLSYKSKKNFKILYFFQILYILQDNFNDFHKQVACGYFDGATTDKQLAKALYSVVNLFYNYTGQTESFCINPNVCEYPDDVLGGLSWSWQVGWLIFNII